MHIDNESEGKNIIMRELEKPIASITKNRSDMYENSMKKTHK